MYITGFLKKVEKIDKIEPVYWEKKWFSITITEKNTLTDSCQPITLKNLGQPCKLMIFINF